MLRLWVCWVGLTFSSLCLAEDEDKLKAAFIYNFTKYVIWPPAIEQSAGPLRVCALGSSVYTPELQQLQGRVVRKFTLEVASITRKDSLDNCHLVYADQAQAEWLVKAGHGKSVLTISDGESFAEQGGLIGLVIEGRRIRFDINLTQAREVQLQISSRLLQLARRVL